MGRTKTCEETFGYTVRIPMELKDDLNLLSKYHFTSMNSEIVTALRRYLTDNRELLDQERENRKEQ